jgi:hypothetical protein
MSTVAVNEITDEVGTGAPAFPNGMSVTGAALTDPEITGGIYLGGTGSANKLDDYEEGTWVPSAINYDGGTLTVNQAFYIKVGNLVWFSFRLTFSGSDPSDVEIKGFPFTFGTALGIQSGSGATVTFNGTNTNGLWNYGSSNEIFFKDLTTNTKRTYDQVDGSSLGASGFYYTDS